MISFWRYAHRLQMLHINLPVLKLLGIVIYYVDWIWPFPWIYHICFVFLCNNVLVITVLIHSELLLLFLHGVLARRFQSFKVQTFPVFMIQFVNVFTARFMANLLCWGWGGAKSWSSCCSSAGNILFRWLYTRDRKLRMDSPLNCTSLVFDRISFNAGTQNDSFSEVLSSCKASVVVKELHRRHLVSADNSH